MYISQVTGAARPGGLEYPERAGQPVCQVLHLVFLIGSEYWGLGQNATMEWYTSA